MDKKVCLDTDVIIHLLNKKEEVFRKVSSLDAHFITTSVNTFEVWFGRKDTEHVEEFLDSLDIITFDDRAARKAADILRSLTKSGKILDFRDVFIASVCITQNLPLMTLNQKDFSRLTSFGLVLV